MKRVLTGIIIVILILIVLPYVMVPSVIHESISTTSSTTQRSAQRYLLDDHQWPSWWPRSPSKVIRGLSATRYFYYNGYAFRLSQQFMSGIELTSDHSLDSIKNLITIVPISKDTVKLVWEFQEKSSFNPITRFQQYNKAKRLKKDVGGIIQALATFLNDDLNTYGITISRTTITDSFLVATKTILKDEPAIADIYQQVDVLKQYASASGAQVTNAPMLNKRRIDSSQIEMMVALPINKALSGKGSIIYRELPAGKLLVAEVQGGPARVREAFRQLENYLVEHKYESPAIPFESLVTNRQQESDTTKWVTRIYYPIF
ncbi:MAG: GyrI-like domain-containing protein [Niastella sp.]|nr:GyrI-like domain-containing protein [Niastella sp.]